MIPCRFPRRKWVAGAAANRPRGSSHATNAARASPAAAETKKRPVPQPPAASPAKPEPVETAETPPAYGPPPRRMEPVLPEDQRRQRIEEIPNRLHEVDQMLTRVQPAV